MDMELEAFKEAIKEGNEHILTNMYGVLIKFTRGNIIIPSFFSHCYLSLICTQEPSNVADQMKDVLKIQNLTQVTNAYRYIMNVLKKNTCFKMANKLYVPNAFKPSSKLVKDIYENYYLESQLVDFNDRIEVAELINKWIGTKTDNRIRNVVNPKHLNKHSGALLINSVCFKGKWGKKFDPRHTTIEDFYVNETTTVQCHMMRLVGQFHYGQSKLLDCSTLILELDQEDFSLSILLPNDRFGFTKLEEKLLSRESLKIDPVAGSRRINVALPRFQIQYSLDLARLLPQLGLTALAETDFDFLNSITGSSLKVTKVLQNVFIEIEENHAESASNTGFTSFTHAINFHANHPFLVAILYQESIPILFGRVLKPIDVC